MKASNKMKALSLAVLGLAGMAFGSSVFAGTTCPTDPAQPAGPWSAKTLPAQGGSIVIQSGGYNGTSCRMDAALTLNAGSAAAFVRDDSPASESRYRAQFFVNFDALGSLNTQQPVRVFAALTDAPANGVPEVVKLTVYGNAQGTSKILGVVTPNGTGVLSSAVTLGNTTGARRIEIDWQKGTNGYLKVWVDNTTEGTPSFNQVVNNNAWGGVDSAALGLTGASPGFRANHLNQAVGYDQFDSRRSAFIGG